MEDVALLLVEDNEADARLCREHLVDAPFDPDVEHVTDVAGAREQLQDGVFDAIVLDLNLPDSTGIDTVEAIQSAAPHLPIVVLTGLEDEDLAAEALNIGAQDYVVKDHLETTLARAIRYAIERHHAQTRLAKVQQELDTRDKLATLGAFLTGFHGELREATEEVTHTLYRLRELVESGGDDTDGEAEELVAEAMEEMDRLDAVTRNLRETYKAQETVEAVPLDAVVLEAVNLFRATMPEGIEVELDLAETPPMELVRGQLVQAVTHLLRNAAEAMPEGGTVRVGVAGTDDGWEVLVVDEGDGIPQGIRDRVYDPFVTTKEDGDGLGLAVADRIVKAHDGELTLETGQGEGTRARLGLPSARVSRGR